MSKKNFRQSNRELLAAPMNNAAYQQKMAKQTEQWRQATASPEEELKMKEAIAELRKIQDMQNKPYKGKELESALQKVYQNGAEGFRILAISDTIKEEFAGSNVTLRICATEDYDASLIEVLHFDWSLADLQHAFVPRASAVTDALLSGGAVGEQVQSAFENYESISISVAKLKEWIYEYAKDQPRNRLDSYYTGVEPGWADTTKTAHPGYMPKGLIGGGGLSDSNTSGISYISTSSHPGVPVTDTITTSTDATGAALKFTSETSLLKAIQGFTEKITK